MSRKEISVAIAVVAMVVLIVGCIDNGPEPTQPIPIEELPEPTAISTPVPTLIPTLPEPKYVVGDIVGKNTTDIVGGVILSFDAHSDIYGVQVVANKDGKWIYYDDEQYLLGRPELEKDYPALLAHVPLSDITVLKEKDAKILSKSTHRDSLNWLHIVGEVENTGLTTLKYVKVIATIYDEDNRVIGTDFTYTQPSTLEPGQIAPFEIICMGDIPHSGSYKLTVAW